MLVLSRIRIAGLLVLFGFSMLTSCGGGRKTTTTSVASRVAVPQVSSPATARRPRSPVAQESAFAVAVRAGDEHACVLTRVGSVRCWGRNSEGQLGDGTTIDRGEPVDSFVRSGATRIAVGVQATCAIVGCGTVRCWGGPYFDPRRPNAPHDIGGIADAIEIATTASAGCVLTSSRRARCWAAPTNPDRSATPAVEAGAPIEALGEVLHLAVAPDSACAIGIDRALRCWGGTPEGFVRGTPIGHDRFERVPVRPGRPPLGRAGRLTSTPTHVPRLIPTPPPTSPAQWRPLHDITSAAHVALGTRTGCVARTDGSIACWGRVAERIPSDNDNHAPRGSTHRARRRGRRRRRACRRRRCSRMCSHGSGPRLLLGQRFVRIFASRRRRHGPGLRRAVDRRCPVRRGRRLVRLRATSGRCRIVLGRARPWTAWRWRLFRRRRDFSCPQPVGRRRR